MEREGMERENEKSVESEGWGKGGELRPSMGTWEKVGREWGGEKETHGGGRHTDICTHRNK